ncbi:SusC/RagA family TonB-linked outer membrane protein [Chitinophaga sancti]|uniref:TonB-dependent receptor n=1 Tax=Chitinophaga sancti TaxID=1004 RepID=A0A1K1PGK9_9BACT|nr:TonB-dependent receptor [Chitinophaga sancti]WQD65877.1 TonB-dependent receptor [Chitinophaga sancti]WQG88501.1 TonB-dependent receptor [Chitinophaga sancti]SFW46579.1 TonB-linked outer membrane protein, SusC/RagA family [Chitinophaga sancti]
MKKVLHRHVRQLPLFLRLSMLIIFMFPVFMAHAQVGKISGRVVAGGQPVPGVTVKVKGTNQGAVTDINGQYSVTAKQGDTLIFNHMSYTPQSIAVAGTAVNATLTEVAQNVGEVVVVGYGVQKKATLTGSISVVKGADIVKSPQPNVSNSLAGRFSGVIANNRAGEPGYDNSNIYIRGLATSNNNDVLVVVDGVPGQIGGLSRLDPNDIESISVLKDASAAVYGSRAANGVILVTTKRGKTGKPAINYSFNQGFSSPTRLPKMADAATFAQIQNEIAYYTSPTGGMNQFYSDAQIQKYKDGSDPLNYPNTDWQKVVLNKSASQQQHNLSVSGGNESVKYFTSLGMISQDGLYRNGATKYDQYNFRSNIDADITKRLKVSLYLSGREEDRNYPISGAGDIFRAIYRAYPTVAAYFPNGLPTYGIEGANPALLGTDIGGTTRNPTQVFNGILKGVYQIPGVEGLSVDGFYSIDKSWNFQKSFSKPYSVYIYHSDTDSYEKKIQGGSNGLATLSEGQLNRMMMTSNIKLNYARQFGAHNISAFVAYEQAKTSQDSLGAYRQNFPSTATPELSQGGPANADKNNYGNSYNFTRKSYISRVTYNYKEKYLLEGQARIDESSTFGSGHRRGFFPSVSAGYRISQEPFFKNIKFINDLKLRASYGSLGNDNILLFQYFENYSFNNQYVIGDAVHAGIDLTKLANPVVSWEVAKKLDVGLNAIFLDHFNMEFIYFKQKRTKILTQRNASIPATSGIVNPNGSDPLVPAENIGQINSGGIEATLGYSNVTSGGVSYGINANFTYAKSKIIYIDEAASVLDYQRQTGHPLNTYLLYNTLGIFRTQADLDKYPHLSNAKLGDLIYEDYNKDGKINANDQTRSQYGNIPEITYGVLLNAGYKGFDASVVFAGQTRVSQYVLPESGTIGNFYSSWADNRWSPTNTGGSYPRVDTRASSSINGGLYSNTFWLNNSSFLRLKNVELGYTINANVLSRARINSLRVFASAYNLFTITHVKDYDPEGNSGSGQFYPQQRIVNLGLNVKF